jgi:hypothetical protein
MRFEVVSPISAIPLDIDLSVGDDYLYALEGGSGKIAIFAVGAGGSLSARTAVPTNRGGSCKGSRPSDH